MPPFNCHLCKKRSLDLREAVVGDLGKVKLCPACVQKVVQGGQNFSGQPMTSAPPPSLKVFVIMRHGVGEATFVNVMSTIFAFYREEDAAGFLEALKKHPNVKLTGEEVVEQIYAMGAFEWAVYSKVRLVSIVAGVPVLPVPQMRPPKEDEEGGRRPGIVTS